MKKERNKERNRGELAIGAVCILLGLLLAVQLKSVKVNTAEDTTSKGRLETLQSLYNDALDQTQRLESQLAQVQSELDLYHAEAAAGGDYNEALHSEMEKLSILAGLTDVQGPGVEVVMRDATVANVTGNEAEYIIHDNDILTVINELRDAGAEALALNGERLLATSEIRCTGAVVSVNGRRYAAPYVITAIGDSAALYGALTMRNGVVDILGQWKIEVTVAARTLLLLPKYEGAVDFRFAAPATAGDAGTEEAVE